MNCWIKNAGHPVLIVKEVTNSIDSQKYRITQRLISKPLAVIKNSKEDLETNTSDYIIPLSIKQQNGIVVQQTMKSSVTEIVLKNHLDGEWVLVRKWKWFFNFSLIGNNMGSWELVTQMNYGKILSAELNKEKLQMKVF